MYKQPGVVLALSRASTLLTYARRACISDRVGGFGYGEKGFHRLSAAQNPERESPNCWGVSSSILPTSIAKTVSAPRLFMWATVRLSMYPPSRSMLPSSHRGGMRPARDILARTYRQM